MRARLDLAAVPGQLTPGERDRLAAALAGSLSTLTHPLRIWHGPRPTDRGRPRATWLSGLRLPHFPDSGGLLELAGDEDGPALPAPLAETVRSVTLAGDRPGGCLLSVARWPATLRLDWLACLAALEQTAAIAVVLDPLPADTAARVIRRRIAALTATLLLAERAQRPADPQALIGLEAATDLQRKLAAGRTALLRASIQVAVTAARVELQEAVAEAREAMVAAAPGTVLAATPFEQRPGWVSLLAGAAAGPAAKPARRGRILDTEAAALCVPLPAPAFLGEPGAPVLGADPGTGAAVRLDRFGFVNPGRLIVGASGAGKSYAARAELRRWLARGAEAMVIDPEGEFVGLAESLGGTVVTGGADPVAVATSGELPEDAGTQLLCSAIAALLGAELSAAEVALLDTALARLRDGGTGTLAGLAEEAAHLSRLAAFRSLDLAARLAPAATGRLAGWFDRVPDETRPLVVADLRATPDGLRPAVTAGLLGWAWARAAAAPRPATPRLVLVDEAHQLLDDPSSARFLAGFARRARKYGIALDVITQRLSDFLADPAGRAVLDSSATRLLLAVAEPERSEIAAALGLSAGDAAHLVPGRPGTGLLLCPRGRLPVRITDPEDPR